MDLKQAGRPSSLPELTELSLSLVMLVVMGLFVGGFAVHEGHDVISRIVTHHSFVIG